MLNVMAHLNKKFQAWWETSSPEQSTFSAEAANAANDYKPSKFSAPESTSVQPASLDGAPAWATQNVRPVAWSVARLQFPRAAKHLFSMDAPDGTPLGIIEQEHSHWIELVAWNGRNWCFVTCRMRDESEEAQDFNLADAIKRTDQDQWE